ncbi:MAG: stage II sporulation protein R [Clostridia bacterium]|nr:stage II sporulation protein R [Clostridia bacterium]
MKAIISFVLSLLCLIFLCGALPVNGEDEIYSGIVRLHILADSDEADAQNLKIGLRDALLQEYGDTMKSMTDAEEAIRFLEDEKDSLKAFSDAYLQSRGSDKTTEISVGREYFSERNYGEMTLPAGYYSSLTVKIGEGKGQNWWCVLYPSLCTQAAIGGTVEETGLTPAQNDLVTKGKYSVKFRSLELLSGLFGK